MNGVGLHQQFDQALCSIHLGTVLSDTHSCTDSLRNSLPGVTKNYVQGSDLLICSEWRGICYVHGGLSPVSWWDLFAGP